MKIGGFQKLSLIDYPGKISSVIFTQGCNFRCGYCHNPRLVLPELFEEPIDEKTILEYLLKRKDKVEGVVVTGGEPTIHKDLPEFVSRIKQHGFKVKLDTNGTNPKMLFKLLKQNLLDYIAMDLKAPLERYETICGVNTDIKNLSLSIKLIKFSGIEHRFRTTIIRKQLNANDLLKIKELINEHLHLQSFIFTGNILGYGLNKEFEWTDEEIASLNLIINKTN